MRGGEGRGGEGRGGEGRGGGLGEKVGRMGRSKLALRVYGCGVYLLRIAVPFDQRLHVH